MPPNDRAVLIHRLADLIEKHNDILAQIEAWNCGKPLPQTTGFEIPHVAKTFRFYADLSVAVRRQEPIAVAGHEARSVLLPYGVCGFIFPWNFPILLLAWAIAPALAAGNTAVIKPASLTPLSSLYFCKLAKEAGIPDGVVNTVTGPGNEVGEAIVSHPDVKRISFTGSTEIGRRLGELAGKHLIPLKLELGGKGVAAVYDDVNVNDVADKVARAVCLNTGQTCCTATRWVVHENIYDQFLKRATDTLKSMKIGHGFDEGTEMGPLVSEKQRETVLGYVERGEKSGAKVLLGTGPLHPKGHENGFYVKPGILTGPPSNVCCLDEIFGPVAYMMPFRNDDELIEMVNSNPYGLANSVWTKDLKRANRIAESLVAGSSWINAHNVFPHGVPYAGVNQSGYGGGVLGPDTFFDYLRKQSVVRPL
jgi:acyl-CoA reductase-like NAD-dependent aldehyde dehydrogenase